MEVDRSLHAHKTSALNAHVGMRLASRGAVWRVAMWLGYAVISLVVTILWFHFARTEVLTDNAPYHFNSIQQMADGTAAKPFVGRRLMPDAALALTRVLPPPESPVWDRFLGLDERSASYFAKDHIAISTGWSMQKLPLLGASMAVMAASVFGFILVCSCLIRQLYVVPPWLTDVFSGLFGIALLGGCNDLHYQLYPYDFTQAFVFSLTLLGILKAKWWLVPAFVLAAYSKETSALLIVAYVLITWQAGVWRSWRWRFRVALLAGLFIAVRGYIAWRYPGFEARKFWYPFRNVHWLVLNTVISSWVVPFLLIPVVRIVRSLDRLPPSLARLAWLIPILVGVAFFKGWLEELRQYTELFPIGALIVTQWAMTELGVGHLMVPRDRDLSSVGPS